MESEVNEEVNIEIDKSEQLYSRVRIPLWGLFIFAIFSTLYFAHAIFIPILLALLASFLLAPAVLYLQKFHIPASVSAVLILAMLTSVMAIGINYLAQPVGIWMDRVPSELNKIEKKLMVVKDSIENVQKTTDKIGDIASTADSKAKKPQEVVMRAPNVLLMLFNSTQDFVIGLVSFLVLLYFLLAHGHSLLLEAGNLWMSRNHRKVSYRILRHVQQNVSRYLLLITMINFVLGLFVALLMWILNMPNPIVWGVSAALLNYIPYVGPVINLVIVTLVAILTFDSPAQMVLPPIALLVLNLLEGQFIQPIFVGRMVTINPVIVFLFILIWGWLWGVAGIFMAVPILMIVKIVIDQRKELYDEVSDSESQQTSEPIKHG